MEGFTIVLLISWLFLLSSFVGMYYLDQATKQAAERKTTPPQQK